MLSSNLDVLFTTCTFLQGVDVVTVVVTWKLAPPCCGPPQMAEVPATIRHRPRPTIFFGDKISG